MYLKHYTLVITLLTSLAAFDASDTTAQTNCINQLHPNCRNLEKRKSSDTNSSLKDEYFKLLTKLRRNRLDINSPDSTTFNKTNNINFNIDPRGLPSPEKDPQNENSNRIFDAHTRGSVSDSSTSEEHKCGHNANHVHEYYSGICSESDSRRHEENSNTRLRERRGPKTRGIRSEGTRSTADTRNRGPNNRVQPSSSSGGGGGTSGGRRDRVLAGGARRLEPRVITLKTELGEVTGTLEFSLQPTLPPSAGRRYYSFRGIPYAEPPLGPLRWAPPVLLKKEWPGGRVDGRRHKSFCPQYDHDHNKVVGKEDCLYLNVYTPFLPGETRRLLPVLVFVHGGAYTRGAASSHGPQRLMTEDLVVVTMNYRLGVLGFLSTGTEELAGNYGALDQVAALQWVQRFIGPFGGDPSSVTLGGFSAGAGFVHLHMLSPLSQGLFHRAILMSGSGNCLWSVQPRPEEIAAELGEDTDCPLGYPETFLDCLRGKSVEELIKAQTDRQRYVYWPYLYRPVVDAGLRESPFLPAPVGELMHRPPLSPVPVLGGTTPHEGVLFALTTILFSRNPGSASQVHDEAAVYLLGCLWPNTSSTQDIARTLHSYYYSPTAKDNLDELLQQMAEAMTDQLFTACLWDAFEHMASSTKAPVYTYLMTHHDPSSPSFAYPLYGLAQNLGVRSPLLQAGVSHGDDVILLFSFPHNQVEPGPRDLQMSALLTNMWANFVSTGSPQGDQLSSSLPPWSPLRPGEPVTFYRLSLTPGMELQPFRKRERNLWQQTLPVVEALSDELEEIVSWQIATWVLSVLCTVLFVALLLVVVGIILARRRKQYPAGTATLRSRQPRSSTYGGPGVKPT